MCLYLLHIQSRTSSHAGSVNESTQVGTISTMEPMKWCISFVLTLIHLNASFLAPEVSRLPSPIICKGDELQLIP